MYIPGLDYSLSLVRFDAVRPSVVSRFNKEMKAWDFGYLFLFDFLRKEESDIRSHTTISDEDFEKIKDEFASVGLHFGMSQDEVDAYIDKDYLKDHPEEAVAGTSEEKAVSRDAETGVVSESEVQEDDEPDDSEASERMRQTAKLKEPVYLTDGDELSDELPLNIREEILREWKREKVEPRLVPQWSDEEAENSWRWRVESINRESLIFKDFSNHMKVVLHAYDKQPWYYRLLPKQCRVKRAFDTSELYINEYIERFVAWHVDRDRRRNERECRWAEDYNRKTHARRKEIVDEVVRGYYSTSEGEDVIDKIRKEVDEITENMDSFWGANSTKNEYEKILSSASNGYRPLIKVEPVIDEI